MSHAAVKAFQKWINAMRWNLLLASFFTLTACESKWQVVDLDGDGLTAADGDCWDSPNDPVVAEGAIDYGVLAADISPNSEIDHPYDGIDQNCDGKDDFDQDEDGHVPAIYAGLATFGLPDSGALPADDCYDTPGDVHQVDGAQAHSLTADQVHGDAIDVFYDGIDQNCDGQDDFDRDVDGYVHDDFQGVATEDETGAVAGTGQLPGNDCWDDERLDLESIEMNPLNGFDALSPVDVNPVAVDRHYDGINQDCGDNVFEFDIDEDGFDADDMIRRDGTQGEDCWDDVDTDPTSIEMNPLNGLSDLTADEINPAAVDRPYDGINQDCADSVFEFDMDGDGFDADDQVQRDGSSGNDCWDNTDIGPDSFDNNPLNGITQLTADQVNPGANETAVDDVDQDCDLNELCYTDVDTDGFLGDTLTNISALDCNQFGFGTAIDDCDDADQTAYPGAAVNEVNSTACMKDSDFDGYGDSNAVGLVVDGSDCNDSNAAINPSAAEMPADELDQNCDGVEDCFLDADQDGYGHVSSLVPSSNLTCDTANSESSVNTDCDDTHALTFPGVAAFDSTTECMRDDDNDNYGDINAPTGVESGTDCDDNAFGTNPGANEIPIDGIDQDCSGGELCYRDDDLDQYGTTVTIVSSDMDCTDSFESVLTTDCDDNHASTFPGAAFLDNSNACMRDADGDGYGDDSPGPTVNPGADCNDSDSQINPDSFEDPANGVDQNCDTLEICYQDSDQDGFGSGIVFTVNLDCSGATESGLNTDCEDSEFFTFPGAAPNDDATACMRDQDGDNFGDASVPSNISAGDDCDDSRSDVHPNAGEIPADNLDQDCNGAELCYLNNDNDAYGTNALVSSNANVSCTNQGEAEAPGDCDDTDPTAFPGSAENESLTACKKDSDGDGYGDSSPSSTVESGLDCNDNDTTIYFGAPETTADGIDQDCDGSDNCFQDLDSDGFGSTVVIAAGTLNCSGLNESGTSTDCDDALAAVNPSASEIIANDRDDDCNTVEICYQDIDGDTFGSTFTTNSTANVSCGDPGEAYVNTDCHDGQNYTYPGAAFNDDAVACMRDQDSDGYGDSGAIGSIAAGDDCDDSNAAINEAAIETIANGVDQDCDGFETCYRDTDGDNFGSGTVLSSNLICTDSGEATVANDCDDNSNATFPGAAELESLTGCRKDSDGDGYGDSSVSGGVSPGGDCNDANNTIHPNASEGVGDGVDQNCDSLESCYVDADLDNHGGSSTDSISDLSCSLSGFKSTNTDCDDQDSDTFPGSAFNESLTDCMKDSDGDGFGADLGANNIVAGTDCNDSEITINPNAVELTADGIDNDCNGFEQCHENLDSDPFGTANLIPSVHLGCLNYGAGVSEKDGDCLDNPVLLTGGHPHAGKIYPGVASNDSTTQCMKDKDGDNYGDLSPPNGVDAGTDCNDDHAGVNPGAVELTADGVDNDCDGFENCPLDLDLDSYGDASALIASSDLDCDDVGESQNTQDCDDSDDHTFPGAAELESASLCMSDGDDDGYGDDSPVNGVTSGEDCDDGSDNLYPYDLDGDGISDGCGWVTVSSDLEVGNICGIDSDLNVHCKRANNTPIPNWNLPIGDFVDISVGNFAACAIAADGSASCFGTCGNGECNIPSGHLWEKIEVGYVDSCGLTTSGDVHCWGNNANFLVTNAPSGTYQDLTLSYRHACAINAFGSLDCWGIDQFDQVSDAPSGTFAAVALGVHHSLFLRNGGTIDCAGTDPNSYGCSSISHAGTYSQIASGYHHSYGVDAFGNVTVFNSGEDPGTAVQTIVAFGIDKNFVAVDTNGMLIHSLPVLELDN